MTRFRSLLSVAGALFFAGTAFALSLSAQVDRTEVGVDDRITLTLTVEGGGGGNLETDLGETGAFHVNSAGTSQNISIINGALSARTIRTYVLTPRGEGTFTIGPFRVREGGEEATHPAIPITVTAGSPSPRKPSPSPRQETGAGPREVFVRAFVDRDVAYVGEQITLTFQLFSRIRFFRDPEYRPPTTEGFWKEDLPPNRRFQQEVDGATYLVNEVRTALFPTRAGRLTIGPATLVYEEDTFFSRDPFDIFTWPRRGRPDGGGVQEMSTSPIEIEVKPLPEEGKPEGFAGAVGAFSLAVELDHRAVSANEPITLTATLSGEGNVQAATLPDVSLSESFKVYDSGSSTDISKEGYRVRGRKTYTRVIVPRYGGEYEIPAVSFSYFDPRAKKYVICREGPFPIEVKGDPATDTMEQQEIARREEDIRYLKELDRADWRRDEGGGRLFPLLLCNSVPLLLLGGIYWVQKRRKRLEMDVVWARSKSARPRAHKILRGARRGLSTEESRSWIARLHRAVTGFVGDRANVAAAGMTKRQLDQILTGRGAGEEARERLARFLDRCDQARYGAGEIAEEERQGLLSEAEELLRLLGRVFGEGGRR